MNRRWNISKLPIKWKLTLSSALLLLLLMAGYNAIQFAFVDRWMVKEQESNAKADMREILNYLLEKEHTFADSEIAAISNYLARVNDREQMIRILDGEGRAIITVKDDFPGEWLSSHETDLRKEQSARFVIDNMLVYRSPLTIFDYNGTVEIVSSMDEFSRLIDAFARVMLICLASAVVLSGFGGWLLSRRMLSPLKAMNETIRNVKQNGLQERMPLDGPPDELHDLMSLFNEMMEQVEHTFKQQRQFVEDASHELRTPVAILEGHLIMLSRWGKDDPKVLDESLQISIHELGRLRRLVEELLLLMRAEQLTVPEYEPLAANAADIVQTSIRNMSMLHPDFQFAADVAKVSNVQLTIAEDHLEQILLIALDNAVKYSKESREVRINCNVNAAEKYATIAVADRGTGIPAKEMPYVLDRFFRADKARSGGENGFGLGLSIAKRIIERYSGKIEIKSEEGKGTTIVFHMPIR
ncbi:HAMP domain-containing histidine kinase [Paenibacillus sp. NEAU-GSW1]|uniref:HAMP domain-containing sensor histidine kinase n=1 Tax=Paenibacillus sp. NEAU-GSW1 TaxID=2682486 RepID=UPI0012E31F1C|nr:HAMP domain-containing histidine kinase [Paenibacillus sp. NEAU-GSW1]MUT68757.1 HAMP domain-containing protein [Paenibacillus sp. NEAU-GSW1]